MARQEGQNRSFLNVAITRGDEPSAIYRFCPKTTWGSQAAYKRSDPDGCTSEVQHSRLFSFVAGLAPRQDEDRKVDGGWWLEARAGLGTCDCSLMAPSPRLTLRRRPLRTT